jgi:hypothetical protein
MERVIAVCEVDIVNSLHTIPAFPIALADVCLFVIKSVIVLIYGSTHLSMLS